MSYEPPAQPDRAGLIGETRIPVTGHDYRAEAAELQARIDAAMALLEDWRENAVPFQYRPLVDALTGKR